MAPQMVGTLKSIISASQHRWLVAKVKKYLWTERRRIEELQGLAAFPNEKIVLTRCRCARLEMNFDVWRLSVRCNASILACKLMERGED